MVTDKDIVLLASPIENKLLRKNWNAAQSIMRSFVHKPLQATTFSNFMSLLDKEDPSRFVNIIVRQCEEMLKYSKKLNSDLRIEDNQLALNRLNKIGATNQVSLMEYYLTLAADNQTLSLLSKAFIVTLFLKKF
jgi:hypothetical protein